MTSEAEKRKESIKVMLQCISVGGFIRNCEKKFTLVETTTKEGKALKKKLLISFCCLSTLQELFISTEKPLKGSLHLHSALSSRGFVDITKPFAHLGQSRVLALVDNSSLLLHRSQMHQKNFASFRCCRLFKVPWGGWRMSDS